ncbi:MAG: glycosyltransferase family 2 protein [Gammaproteobacteria bacterium]|nr:glycosyltransferase family 2 protein [Gammaproteobacteria bacterium]
MIDHPVVVIPAFNEAATLRTVAQGVLAHVADVIIVDDGSRDGTGASVSDLPVTLLTHGVNCGKGASLCTGAVRALAGPCAHIVTMDADGQHDPGDLPSLLAIARDYPDAFVIGARMISHGPRPPLRLAANRLADWAVSRITGCRVIDSQSGLRVYPRRLFETLMQAGAEGGFAFETRALITAAQLGMPLLLIPIEARYPAHRRPSHYRPVRDTIRIARLLVGEWLHQVR